MLRKSLLASIMVIAAGAMIGCKFDPIRVELFKSLDEEYQQYVLEQGLSEPNR